MVEERFKKRWDDYSSFTYIDPSDIIALTIFDSFNKWAKVNPPRITKIAHLVKIQDSITKEMEEVFGGSIETNHRFQLIQIIYKQDQLFIAYKLPHTVQKQIGYDFQYIQDLPLCLKEKKSYTTIRYLISQPLAPSDIITSTLEIEHNLGIISFFLKLWLIIKWL